MSTGSAPPNMIFFFTDQQRWDSCGVNGSPLDLTPNFDRLASEGTHCPNAFTCQPVCLPARICLQTGKYASRFHIYSNAGQLPVEEPTLGHFFRAAGYHTGYVGKWHMCHEEPVPPEKRSGYDFFMGANVLEFTSDAYDLRMYDNEGKERFFPGYRVDGETDVAIRYVAEHRDHPFFLMISYLEPHFQNTRDDYPAPTGYEQAYQDAWMPPDLKALGGTSARHLPGYYGMIKRLDEALGRLMDALRSLDLLGNTVIVFTTDHGCHFKTRNGEYKRSCHDASIRIPMAFTGPGFMAGGRLRECVSLLDVPPTLLEACGIEVPGSMQGRSILPLTRGDGRSWPGEAYVEIFDPPHLVRCVRTPRWTYSIERTEKGMDPAQGWTFAEGCLFDNMADPWQLENLMGKEGYRGPAEIMRGRLLRRMAEAGEPEPEIVPTEWRPSGQRRIRERDWHK